MINALLTCICAVILASPSGTLAGLWDKYEKSSASDKPAEKIRQLAHIKEKAKSEGSAWDFYKAGELEVQVGTSVNWKLRDSLETAFRKSIESFGAPVATFYYRHARLGTDSLPDADREKLAASSNPEFWKRDGRIGRYSYESALVALFRNDLDYACWCVDENNFDGIHPLCDLYEFRHINYNDTTALKAFAAGHKGEATALLAEGSLLWEEFHKLNRSDGSSDGYLALKRRCEEYNQQRKLFKGDEKAVADCCTDAESLLLTLESEEAEVGIRDGILEVALRNRSKALVTLTLDGKTVFRRDFTNTARSFYRRDTIRHILPKMDDGNYILTCTSGDLKSSANYDKYTISAAYKYDADGAHVFLADYLSGKPCLDKGYEKIKDGTEEYVYSFRDDGGILHSCRPTKIITVPRPWTDNEPDTRRCIILADRTAFTPGETMHFKAVLYNGMYRLRCAGPGIKVTAVLVDADGLEIASEDLVTNEFGSVAGEFEMTRGKWSGTYELILKEGDEAIGFKHFRVDDFVLPTFELIFDGGDYETLDHRPDSICFSGTLTSLSGHSLGAAQASFRVYGYGLPYDGRMQALHIRPDGSFSVSVATDTTLTRWGTYSISILAVDATGETQEFSKSVSISIPGKDKSDGPFTFKDIREGGVGVEIIAGTKPVWAVVDLYGTGNRLLESRLVHFEPEGGIATGKIIFDYKASYPDVVTVQTIYFQDGKSFRHDFTHRRENHRLDLPLSFSRFLDTTLPGSGYTFSIKTAAGVECAATIFDKSTESIQGNRWNNLRDAEIPESSIYVNVTTGRESTYAPFYSISPLARNAAVMKSAAPTDLMMDAIPAAEESAVAESASGAGYIRSNFANTVAWEPFLRSDADGTVNFSFTNADKLSTYYVQIFAHDKSLRNEVLRREMTITIPVKVAVVQPQFLLDGDRYTAAVTVSNALDKEVSGTVWFNGGSPVKVLVPARGQAAAYCQFDAKGGELPLEVVFSADSKEYGSDGVRVAIPVRPAVQTITEAHSGILKHGMDRDSLVTALREQFTGTDGAAAELTERSILEMINEALPDEIEPRSDNVIDLARAVKARWLCRSKEIEKRTSDERLTEKIMACRNADGGFGWFAGMKSSPILTAYVLAMLDDILKDADSAVNYLDNVQFSKEADRFYYKLSPAMYMYVRSLYPEIGFGQNPDREFKKFARSYLGAKKNHELDGQIMGKARRVITLRALCGSDEGIRLAKKWGVKLGTASKMEKREKKDLESLSQYAVRHREGAVYFPNAVMPWRGLMETELDAHNTLCKIFDGHEDGISNGIRLWMMLQKETQKWDDAPAFIESVEIVLDAPDEVLDTRVVALKGTYSKPLAEVKAAGNGFAIAAADVTEGKVGDRVRITYTIHSDENRSFVKLTLPRCASLRPVNQLSGIYGWNGYRSVLDDRTEFWFDSYPEETVTITEEFYITQEGSFQCPAATVECLYADHYRANSDARPAMNTTR